jgi:hypothetical protein
VGPHRRYGHHAPQRLVRRGEAGVEPDHASSPSPACCQPPRS